MTPVEDLAFTEFLREKTEEAKKLGYNPTGFLGMLTSQGGYFAAVQLLAKSKPSDGLLKLWELGRLDLSVEALVVETKWRAKFDGVLLRQAERLLSGYKYDFKRYEPPPISDSDGATKPEAGAPELPSTRRRNSLSFSAFCEKLGAPLKNVADRWCGISHAKRLAVFTIWADRLADGRCVLWDAGLMANDNRIGATELKQVVDEVMAKGYSAYGILCEPKDRMATKRERGFFHEDKLLSLHFVAESQNVIAHIVGEVAASDVAANRAPLVTGFESATDDLGAPPPGAESPQVVKRTGTGYRRDNAVRQYVIRRSEGRCEYCGERGFELLDDRFYVEAHHVIALAAEGPDTVRNVIALCPEHHRQAHYGKVAEELEAAFLLKLVGLNAALPNEKA